MATTLPTRSAGAATSLGARGVAGAYDLMWENGAVMLWEDGAVLVWSGQAGGRLLARSAGAATSLPAR